MARVERPDTSVPLGNKTNTRVFVLFYTKKICKLRMFFPKKVKQTIRREKSLFFSSLEIFYGLKIKNNIKSRYANKRV